MSRPHPVLLPERHELPTLTSSHGISLRQLSELDVPALFELFCDPEVTRYFGIQRFESPADAEQLLREILEGFQERNLYQWAVCLAGKLVGTATLFRLDSRNQRAELGFALARAHWGRGVMANALPTLLDYAFHQLELHRLEADVDPRNAASIKRLESLGFVREGLAPQRWLVDGAWQDSLLYGLLAARWREGRSAPSR